MAEFISPGEAARLIRDRDWVFFGGSGGGSWSRSAPGSACPRSSSASFRAAAAPCASLAGSGEGRAKEMMSFGDPIDAATALSCGLVNRVVPNGESLRIAQSMAATLERPKKALQVCKKALDLSFDVSEDEAVAESLVLSGRFSPAPIPSKEPPPSRMLEEARPPPSTAGLQFSY